MDFLAPPVGSDKYWNEQTTLPTLSRDALSIPIAIRRAKEAFPKTKKSHISFRPSPPLIDLRCSYENLAEIAFI